MRHARVSACSVLALATLLFGLAPEATANAPGANASGGGPHSQALFKVGAAVASITPPARGAIAHDPPNCSAPGDNGPRRFAFEEPYADAANVRHYALGDSFAA